VPVTLDNIRLKMEWPEHSVTLSGEHSIDADSFLHDPRQATLSLTPEPRANPTALAAIEQADLIVVAPGDLYTSLGPLLVVDGVGDALRKTKAKTMYVANLVTKKGQTDGFSVSDHAAEIERFAGGSFLDYVLYNKQVPSSELAARYQTEGAYVVKGDTEILMDRHYLTHGGDFLGEVAKTATGDALPVTRSYIRHNAHAVVHAIMELYETAYR
jgi:uncharacterized cofD-like protein